MEIKIVNDELILTLKGLDDVFFVWEACEIEIQRLEHFSDYLRSGKTTNYDVNKLFSEITKTRKEIHKYAEISSGCSEYIDQLRQRKK